MKASSLVDLSFYICSFSLFLKVNIWFLLLIVVLFSLVLLKKNKYIKKNNKFDINPVKLSFNIGGNRIEYEIQRNYQNIEIAHKIYIELITRKAAIPIDEDNDVIVEVYNSWYTLFQTTRDHLKQLSGEILLKKEVSDDLIKLLTDVLNKGLRPHLTQFQAKFRKWYNEALSQEINRGKSPQQIQQQYGEYSSLIKSMRAVNQCLIEYSNELLKISKGAEN